MKKFIIILFVTFFSCLSDEETTQDNYVANLYGTYFLGSYTDTAGNSYNSEFIVGECSNDMLIITAESIKYQYDVIFDSMCDFNLASEQNFNYQIVGDANLISGIVREEVGSLTGSEGLRFNYGNQWQYEDYNSNYFELENNELLYVEEFQNSNGVVFTCAMVWIKQESND
tara:strand:+ start:139 stop:651 length:513 start_codon:yes stop_codon:yes gene_type:complete